MKPYKRYLPYEIEKNVRKPNWQRRVIGVLILIFGIIFLLMTL